MTYRVLNNEEWNQVEKEFVSRGHTLPDKERSFIIGAINSSNEIVGFLVCQNAIHLEPMVSDDPLCVRGLQNAAEKILGQLFTNPTIYCFAKDRVGDLAKALGYQETSLEVFKKEI